jgi:plasmid stabilization system protein ParE
MKSGFKVYWTDFALTELENTVQYLESNFSEKELKTLAQEIEHTVSLISMNPMLFQESNTKKGVRKVVVSKYNNMYYHITKNRIEIISFFSNRQNSVKR